MFGIGLLLAGLAIAFISVAILTYAAIKKWFRENSTVDKDNVRAIIQEAMDNGEYRVVKCVFNRKRKEITAVKGYHTKERDDELIKKGPEAIIKEEC